MVEPKSNSPSCFIDTNIWLYAFIDSQDKNKHAVANQIVQKNKVVISTQVINEICVNLLKKAQFLEQDIQAIILSFYGHYPVAEIDRDVLINASELRTRYSLSFWDSIIVATALLSGCEILYSEDMQHNLQINNKLIIQNPFN